MLAAILEDGYLFLAAGAITIIAAVIRLLLGIGYSWWGHTAYAMELEALKETAEFKKRFAFLSAEKPEAEHVNIFVDKYLNTRKICGLYLSTWESISGQARLLCCVIAVAAVAIGRYYECGQDEILSTFFISIGGIALLFFVDNFTALVAKKERLKINLIDYFMLSLQKKECEEADETGEIEAAILDEDEEGKLYEDYTAKEYNKRVVRAERKLIQAQKDAEEKAVFRRIKEQAANERREKKKSIRESRQQAEQEAMAEMRKRREEKQKERKERALEELRQQALAEEAEKEAQLAAAKSDAGAYSEKEAETLSVDNVAAAETAAGITTDLPEEKTYPEQMQNQIIADVLKQFL